PKPRPELTELILRLYPDVDDELVRRYLMSSMAQLADRDRALAFLRKIAEQEKDSFPDEACKAIRVLLAAGPDGPRIIREIRDAKSARNEGIQRVVDFLVEDGFKVWPPCWAGRGARSSACRWSGAHSARTPPNRVRRAAASRGSAPFPAFVTTHWRVASPSSASRTS